MSVPARAVHKRRATITDLPLYYCGHLQKKLSKEKSFKKYYAELRGATLFLYKDDTQATYIEKLDLGQLKSMVLDSPYQRKTPTIFTLTLHQEEVQLNMDNSDTGEEWRGYILTVVKKEIPNKLQLLPGQMLLLQDVLDQEIRRCPFMPPPPPLPPRPSSTYTFPSTVTSPPPSTSTISPPLKHQPDQSGPEMPACFFSVTRQEAEQMLEANPKYGSIILRPSTLTNTYALTLRQQITSGHVLKNFRVTSTNAGFVIELDTAVTVSSLDDVLKYFLEKTEYRLLPYMACQAYDTHIDMSPAPKCISITSPTLKTVPKAQVAPMLHSQAEEKLLPTTTNPEDSEYVDPDKHYHNLKLVQEDGELREVLKLRGNLYTDEEKATTSENQTTEKSPSGMVQWITESRA
ncbi:signal-transducing adaptor protein 1-like [Cottoperca gobio]|uniref:Signal-transducing adaptor protein 1-like n=1 Tax=Cottoperca gobio TaxID=56716 RepID=A0A6J2QI13_COTGO|nr:signal-transducing adaptor protein 1-like [Cottoperca gobio]